MYLPLAQLILNSKKGWTDEARRAALLKRKRKAKVLEERSSRGSSKASTGTVPLHGELVGVKKNRAGEHILANGKKIPKHIPKIPPAWTNVQVNVNPNASLYVKGTDAKGRVQSVYSPSHTAKQAAKKFTKVNELRKKKDQILNELQRDMKKPATREVSIVLALINHTGIRPGSSTDTKAAKQAYGATTLKAEHVRDGGTRLKFTGKKGVALDIKVTDPTLVKVLAEKAKLKNKGEKLFDVDDAKLRDYTHSKDGGGFNPKDFRTAKGTEAAIAAMSGLKAPRNEAEYKKLVKKIATEVSKQLGNTPTIALQSYIDPTVFASWRIK
jgi:DNA topoisomerase-1